ncbi:MAG: hypothetical protein RR543_01025 [Erysipelotrichales bacterium]
MFRNRKLKITVLLLTIVLLGLALVEMSGMLKVKENSKKPVITTENVGPYTIRAERTKLQEDLLPKLKEALDTKKGKPIVTEASKYFISDYFTLRDKKTSNMIGGTGFVYKPVKETFKTNAKDSYYNDLGAFKENYGKENLPLVTNVNVEGIKRAKVDKTTLKKSKDQKIMSVFDATLSWQYEENDKLDTSKITNKIIVRFVKDNNNNWYVYELIGAENNEG